MFQEIRPNSPEEETNRSLLVNFVLLASKDKQLIEKAMNELTLLASRDVLRLVCDFLSNDDENRKYSVNRTQRCVDYEYSRSLQASPESLILPNLHSSVKIRAGAYVYFDVNCWNIEI